jgi:DNA-binding beta-propeller fold protein YncE
MPRSGLGFAWCALLGAWLWSTDALALTVEVTHAGPSVVGEAHNFTATTDATGPVTFEWRFGEAAEFEPGEAQVSHAFTTPGLHSIDVTAKDEAGGVASAYFRHLVHYPLTPSRPSSSSSIVYDAARNRIFNVNQDNDTISSIDPDSLVKLGELEVYSKPESLALSPTGKLWVVHQDDYAVAVVNPDTFAIEGGFRLPYASQPVAIAMSPTGDAAYISLMALGKLLKLDPTTGIILGEADVGPKPRGIAVSHDGKDVYVTRFISSDAGGELVKVEATTMTVQSHILLRLDSETADSDQMARGLPNYLFTVGLTPDGRQAWVPGKKDNISRGLLRDGLELTHDTTVRPLVCIVDTQTSAELYDSRVDLDDRSMPVHVEFTPYGNLAILALAGSNRLEVRDVNRPTQVFSAIANVGTFPRASVLAPNGRLFVQGALSRSVLVYDLTTVIEDFDQSTPPQIADIAVVANDRVPPEVLLGKKLFHTAEDTRLAFEGYMSCGGCHFEGIDDGRTYDFSTRGEGLRNTLSLKGTGQGRLNWTGTLDEVQDFEHQIRDLFGGLGFIADEVLATGTRALPLGDAKAGLSADLDALSAYVRSLDHANPSPYRNPDASLTSDGVLGKALFEKLGCDFCHAGPEFTDSERGLLHDVGTLTALSGAREGQPLLGLDTPTLLGVWETAPYLHDGSAPTLRDVLTTKNPTELHGYVSALLPEQLDQLVSYLLQIDNALPIRPLPFDPPMPQAAPTSSVAPGAGAASPEARGVDADSSSCSLRRAGTASPPPALPLCGLGLLVAAAAWRRRRGVLRAGVSFAPTCSALALAVLGPALLGAVVLGCSPGASHAEEGYPDWSELPPANVDPELAQLGVREATVQRVCARGRADSFARALCTGGQLPEIRDMVGLLELAGLSDSRAFALTGNSTSLVAQSVSAINPRLIVFPRVGAGLERPAEMTAVGFVRGEQFVEVVSRDLVTDDFNFYLLNFEQRCNYESAGCDLASLLTEELEHDWMAYSVYDHDDLEPTSFDCLSCHAPGPAGSKRILRMQELDSPWLHWFPQRFSQRTESDRALVAQFAAAHGVESQYGGIPIATIVNAVDEGSGAQLEALIRAEGSGEQPNPFDGHIATEVGSGNSPTWQARFETHLRGEAIAVPYPLVDVTDAAQRDLAVQSYLGVVTQAAPRESLVDIREVFSEDARQKLSFEPTPGADGRTVLLQMCSRCHDGRGDPNSTKSRFNVLQLGDMSRMEKDLAILRINALDETRMPPWRVGTLTPESILAATTELQK